MYNVVSKEGLAFADVDGGSLAVNLYRPDVDAPAPVAIYLHGGGWQNGDRSTDVETRVKPMVARGLAIVTVDYRLAKDASYPAQIHDVKAVARWVRGASSEHGLLNRKVGVWGASAGAMLGTLAALTGGHPDLEGDLGRYRNESSALDVVVHWCGPTDFATAATRSPLESRILPPPPESALFGERLPADLAAVARAASPVTYVSGGAPPILIVHGDRDRLVPYAEAQAFHAALSRAGSPATLVTLGTAGHDDTHFDTAANLSMTADFLLAHLANE